MQHSYMLWGGDLGTEREKDLSTQMATLISALIGAAGLIVASVAGAILTALFSRSSDSAHGGGTVSLRQIFNNKLSLTVIMGVAVIVGLLLGLATWLFLTRSEPMLTIATPGSGKNVTVVRQPDTGSVRFTVSGNSSDVASNVVASDSRLEIYILVRPPSAPSWYVQPPADIEPAGDWTALAWYGSKQFPPQEGDNVSILAIVARPRDIEKGRVVEEGDMQLRDPRDASPLAQSDVIKLRIGRIDDK